jgi:hypothetical protein
MLVISLGIAFLTSSLDSFFNSPTSLSIVAGVFTFFGVSAIIWGPLYTWMVIVMLIWGRGKSMADVRRLYLLSPVLLACSTGIPAIVFSAPGSIYFLVDGFLQMNNLGFVSTILLKDMYMNSDYELLFAWFFMAAICLLVGYVFVGIVLWIERILIKRGKFKDEIDIVAG